MNGETEKPVLASLLDRHGRTFSEELGINLARGTSESIWVESDSCWISAP